MTQYTVECSMYACAQGSVEFPEGKTWDDVEDWYVKWDTLHVRFEDDPNAHEFALNSDGLEAIDWKRPPSVTVYAVDPETEETDYDKEIAND